MSRTETAFRLTTGQVMRLNHGQIKLPNTLESLIRGYQMPPICLSKPYDNPHNPYFSNGRADREKLNSGSRTMATRKAVAAHTDDHILQDIRKAFASIVKGKDGTVLSTSTINRMLIPVNKIEEIADLFFHTMVQCSLQIEEYLHVLFGLKRPDNIEQNIRLTFAKKTMYTFNNPVKLQDTKIADGATLTRQHREATCMIVAKLFSYNYRNDQGIDLSGPHSLFSSYTKLQEKYLEPLINIIGKGDADTIKILANSLKFLILSAKYPSLQADYQEALLKIYRNTDFKLTARLPIKDYIIS
jgi:hypothetical protein